MNMGVSWKQNNKHILGVLTKHRVHVFHAVQRTWRTRAGHHRIYTSNDDSVDERVFVWAHLTATKFQLGDTVIVYYACVQHEAYTVYDARRLHCNNK